MSIAAFFAHLEQKTPLEVILCEDDKEAKKLRDIALFFQKDVITFPDFRATYGDDLRAYKEELHQLLDALYHYHKNATANTVVIAPLRSMAFQLPKKELFTELSLSFGDDINIKELQNTLLEWGYNFVDIVETTAEVSFRGDIIDIYPPSSKTPFRISLFDTQIEQIKPFDVQTQRTLKEEKETLLITPALFGLSSLEYQTLLEKVENSPFEPLSKDIASLGLWHLDTVENFLENKSVYFLKNLTPLLQEIFALQNPTIEEEFFQKIPILEEKEGYQEIIPIQPKALLLAHKDKDAIILAQNKAILKQYELYDEENFTYKQSPLIVNILTPKQLIISLNKEQKQKRRKSSAILLMSLKKGIMSFMKIMALGSLTG